MAEIVNLRQYRKGKKRAEKERKAEDNRIAHGLSKAEKSLAKAKTKLSDKKLDGKQRTDDTD